MFIFFYFSSVYFRWFALLFSKFKNGWPIFIPFVYFFFVGADMMVYMIGLDI